jgi:hypothetical protein
MRYQQLINRPLWVTLALVWHREGGCVSPGIVSAIRGPLFELSTAKQGVEANQQPLKLLKFSP